MVIETLRFIEISVPYGIEVESASGASADAIVDNPRSDRGI
jgi:hypothetical protein